MDADLYNRLMMFLIDSPGTKGLFLADEIKNIYGASALRRGDAPHDPSYNCAGGC